VWVLCEIFSEYLLTGNVFTYIVIDVSSQVYIKIKINIELNDHDLDLHLQPIVDGGLVSDPFLPDEPAELLRKGRNCSLQKEIGLFNPFI
jgi:hypothetical protein